MRDPVIAADGHTYEREAIQEWLAARVGRPAHSPVTGQLLDHVHVLPNLAMRALLDSQ